MNRSHRNSRLFWVFVMILGSSVYGILVAANALTGIAVGLGYVGFIMTIFVLNELWRRDE